MYTKSFFKYTKYRRAGCPFNVQKQASDPTTKIKIPVATKTYGAEFEKSELSSRYLCNSSCIQIPAQIIANPDA